MFFFPIIPCTCRPLTLQIRVIGPRHHHYRLHRHHHHHHRRRHHPLSNYVHPGVSVGGMDIGGVADSAVWIYFPLTRCQKNSIPRPSETNVFASPTMQTLYQTLYAPSWTLLYVKAFVMPALRTHDLWPHTISPSSLTPDPMREGHTITIARGRSYIRSILCTSLAISYFIEDCPVDIFSPCTVIGQRLWEMGSVMLPGNMIKGDYLRASEPQS